MEFSVYLCISFIFCYYGSQTTAFPSDGSSERFFKFLTDYVKSVGGYKEGGLQTGDVRSLPLPILILPVPAASDQSEDHNYNLGFKSRSGFQQVNSQTNPRQLHNQFTVQDTADGDYSNSNVLKTSGRPLEVTKFVKIPANSNLDQSEDHNYNLGFQSRSGSQQVNSQTNPRQLHNQFTVQDTADGDYSNSNVQKSSGRPLEITKFVKIPANSNLGVEQELDDLINSHSKKTSAVPLQSIIRHKEPSYTNIPHIPHQNEDHNYNLGFQSRSEFQQVNSQTHPRQLHSQFIVQDTADGDYSNINVQKTSGRPLEVTKFVKIPANSNLDHRSETPIHNLGFQSRSEFQQVNSQTNPRQLHNQFNVHDTADGDYSNSNVEKNSGRPHEVTIFIKTPSNSTLFPGVEQELEDLISHSNKTLGIQLSSIKRPKEPSHTNIPHIPQSATTSEGLLRQFHAQFAHLQGEDLPPAVIDKAALEVTYDSRISEDIESGLYLPATDDVVNPPKDFISALPRKNSPPIPKWNFPLKMKAELLIPRSEYTEPCQTWFNSRTGASKIDLHEGGTVIYRMPTRDGRQVKVSKRINRLGESNIAECIVSSPQEADFSAQGLPDLTNYHFNGYINPEQGTFEKWVYELQGNPGQYGASIQESLTFRHEMVVKREARKAIPVTYTVKIDSSLLGANCDGYSHRYFDVEDLHEDDESQFNFDIDANCQRIETADVTNPVHRILLDPLHEFTLPGRDERYDGEFATFKTQHSRTYIDHTEEAMRKILFIHTCRFITSLNRQSATFVTGMNYLGDRLEAEWALLRGIDPLARDESEELEEFPHPESEVRKLSRKLPREFDWRPLGAVSHVRNQGSCPCCWAFSVAGAVEGALFVRKRRLVPLSEQCLVDCGEQFGIKGCKNTWPSVVYNYVKARGLPALDEYPPYIEKKQTCKKPASDPITHISAYVNVTHNNVQALQIAIRRHSPTVVIIDGQARSVRSYTEGVLYDERCKKSAYNHAVLAVGWGEHRRQPYFILKNSWGPGWGDQGYIKVNGPANTCGVLNKPSYPRLEDSDVDRLPN